ncbi:MAG: ATP-binding protein [Rubrivivax sp.]
MLLSQLLDSLVDNALKYCPADAPVEITFRRQGDQLVLAVRDRGEGAPPAWRERIFEILRCGEAQAEYDRPGAPA